MESLKELYYNPRTGFSSAVKLYEKAKAAGIKVTLEQVKEFVGKQLTAQVNKQDRRPKIFSSIVSTKHIIKPI